MVPPKNIPLPSRGRTWHRPRVKNGNEKWILMVALFTRSVYLDPRRSLHSVYHEFLCWQ